MHRNNALQSIYIHCFCCCAAAAAAATVAFVTFRSSVHCSKIGFLAWVN